MRNHLQGYDIFPAPPQSHLRGDHGGRQHDAQQGGNIEKPAQGCIRNRCGEPSRKIEQEIINKAGVLIETAEDEGNEDIRDLMLESI
jgi:hypothetical protein